MHPLPAAAPAGAPDTPPLRRAAMGLATAAAALPGACLLAMAGGDAALAQRASAWICPRAAFACATVALGLVARLASRGRRHGRRLARAAAAATLACAGYELAHLAAAARGTVADVTCAALTAPGAQMAALTALLLGAGGAALWARSSRRPRRTRTAVRVGSIMGIALAGACVCAYVYGTVPPAAAGPRRIPTPAASLSLALLHAALLASSVPGRAARELCGELLGARIGRRILAFGSASLLGFGLLRVQLQRWGWVSLEEGTAALITAMLAALVAFCWYQARLVNHAILAQHRAVTDVEAISRQHEAVSHAHATARARLDSVLQAAVDYAIIGTDAAGVITVFSDGAARMLAYPAAEMVDRATPLCFHDSSEIAACARQLGVPPTMAVFVALADRQTSDTREWTYISRLGQRLPVSLSVAGIRDHAGTLLGLVGVARDLTAFKASERMRESILHVGQELLCVATADGCLHHTNPAFWRILGYRADEVDGQSFIGFVHPEDVERTHAASARAAAGEAVQRFENRWRHRDGSYRWIAWDCTPCDVHGSIYAGGWDVTAEKARAQEAARQAEFEQQLIGIVSHDLRNPINVISLTAGAIARRPEVSRGVRRMVARIERTGARAERMLHDLLDFTQARQGGLRIAARRADLDASLGEVLDEIRLLHPDRRIALTGGGGAPLHLDPDRVAQAVGNLVTNAVHYSPADAAVTVRVQARDGALVIAVHNDGPPIDPALMPRLFQPLQRGAGSSSQRNVGLGLYIVDQIARAHGGRVGVRSGKSAGTLFEMVLPHALDAEAAAAVAGHRRA